jgi:hypothetical protein
MTVPFLHNDILASLIVTLSTLTYLQVTSLASPSFPG